MFEVATFGGGCFWGMEKFFKQHFKNKQIQTEVGYMNPSMKKPVDYKEICTGKTGYAEALQVLYDTVRKKTKKFFNIYFFIQEIVIIQRIILIVKLQTKNPTELNRQGGDMGTQYRSVIFPHNDDQATVAKEVIAEMNKTKWNNSIITSIEPAKPDYFVKAEEYHQKYLEKIPEGYCNHRLFW